MPLYLSRFDNQPKFYWDQPGISLVLGEIRFRQGLLLGRIEMLGSSVRKNPGQEGGIRTGDQRILTEDRLLEWHGGSWRNAAPAGIRGVHASSPRTPVLRSEIRKFLNWFNGDSGIDPVLKAAIAYFWFLVISPFDQGNEAVAALIADLQLSRADGCTSRYYDVDGQLQRQQRILDELMNARRGETDITVWLECFLDAMSRALVLAEQGIAALVKKARFTDRYSGLPLNDRQQLVIHRLLENETRISSSQWASLAACSQDTALRDIQDLMDRSILMREAAGGRSTQYVLRERLG
jgi:Fic family protein